MKKTITFSLITAGILLFCPSLTASHLSHQEVISVDSLQSISAAKYEGIYIGIYFGISACVYGVLTWKFFADSSRPSALARYLYRIGTATTISSSIFLAIPVLLDDKIMPNFIAPHKEKIAIASLLASVFLVRFSLQEKRYVTFKNNFKKQKDKLNNFYYHSTFYPASFFLK